MSVVPDKVAPELGWRGWRVEDAVDLELCSVTTATRWLPGEALRAVCEPAPGLYPLFDRLPCRRHSAPRENCACGIHALHSAKLVLNEYRIMSVSKVLGRVSLWGKVIPGEKGWRAEYAYPAELFVLATLRNFDGILRWHSLKRMNELAERLQAWQVPVHVVENPLALIEHDAARAVA